MAKRWVKVKMPELQDKDFDLILRIYLRSEHCRNLKFSESKGPKISKKETL